MVRSVPQKLQDFRTLISNPRVLHLHGGPDSVGLLDQKRLSFSSSIVFRVGQPKRREPRGELQAAPFQQLRDTSGESDSISPATRTPSTRFHSAHEQSRPPAILLYYFLHIGRQSDDANHNGPKRCIPLAQAFPKPPLPRLLPRLSSRRPEEDSSIATRLPSDARQIEPHFVVRTSPLAGNRLKRALPHSRDYTSASPASPKSRNRRRRFREFRPQLQADLSDDRERSERTSIELREIVAGHILHDAAAGLGNAGRRYQRLSCR